MRAKVVLLAAQGRDNEEIARRLDLSRPKVSKWRGRFFHERLAGVEERPCTGRPRVFPPDLVCQVKAPACQLPAEFDLPLSRFWRSELQRLVVARGLLAQISGATVWRWLHAHALRPGTQRSWIFPAAPDCAQKAGVVLELSHRCWQGAPLAADDYVLAADQKTQLQIRQRPHPSQPPEPHRPLRVDDHYRRHGTCAYPAACDVQRGQLCGQMLDQATRRAFDALVATAMRCPPYATARRVLSIVDTGTIHRGARTVRRLQTQWPQLVLVHLPVHASWLNQIEIYFAVRQRNALTPDDFPTRVALEDRVIRFQEHYQQVPNPSPGTSPVTTCGTCSHAASSTAPEQHEPNAYHYL